MKNRVALVTGASSGIGESTAQRLATAEGYSQFEANVPEPDSRLDEYREVGHDKARDKATTRRPTALITGASNGIGYELAKRFAQDRAGLVLVARSGEKLATVADELRSLGAPNVEVVVADLAGADSVPALLRELSVRRLEIDVLVNNAGYGQSGSFATTDRAAELGMIQLNIGALTALTKAILPGMLARGRGRILNVASIAGFLPGPFAAVYAATKAYVVSFSEALAEELAGTGVSVTTLAPGPTATGFAARANMQRSRLFRLGTPMTAHAVAAVGYSGLKRGRRLVVPGVINKIQLQSLRLSPRPWVIKIARALFAS
jgi:short-subunit dehydrogenase